MVILQKAGAKKVGFITDPLPNPRAADTDRIRTASMVERASDRWVSIVLSVLLHGTLVAALVYGFLDVSAVAPANTDAGHRGDGC